MTPTLLRAEYEAGATVRDLRRRFGAGAERVLRLLAEAETPIRRRGPRPTLEADMRRAEARALREAGLSYRAIARRLGCEISTAWRLAKGSGA